MVTEDEQPTSPEPDPQLDQPLVTKDSPKPKDRSRTWFGLIIVLLVAIVAVQFVQLQRTNNLADEIVALESDVTDLKPLRRAVDLIGEQMATLDQQVAAAVQAGSTPASLSTTSSDGNLPQFTDPNNDIAVIAAMQLPEIDGPEYYSGNNVSYVAGDGKARVWMIWAHWCPYCQAELPDLNAWWPENAARFPNVDLVTVTTAIDETRGNPLEEYLDTSQFQFPVIVDDTGELGARFGTSAFPFWVVTDTEGRVVFRVAGALGIDNVDQIFAQLETMSTEL